MLGTSDGTFCPLSKLWCKSPQTEFFGLANVFLYKVELSKEGAQPWSGHGTDDKSEEGWYKVIEHEGSRIIVTYSPTRA